MAVAKIMQKDSEKNMFKLALLAAVFAFAQGGILAPGYAGIGYAGPAAPVAYAAAPVVAPVAQSYALPAPRVVEET